MRVYRILSALTLVGALVASTARAQDVPPPPPPEEGAEVPVESFNDALSPHGEWIEVAGLGRVWRPYRAEVGDDFRPYATGGQWVYTDVGWTFASTYSWGWAPFHYGHWWFDNAYGWVWFPGSRWAPAWVEWRYGGGYVGWAPVAPPGFHFGFEARWGSPWCFVETRYISTPRITTYVVPVTRVRTVYTVTQSAPLTRVYGRNYYSAGPPASHVTSVTGTPVRPVPVAQVVHARPPARVSTVRSAETVRPGAAPVRVEPQRSEHWQQSQHVEAVEPRRTEVHSAPAARPNVERVERETVRAAPVQAPANERRDRFQQHPQATQRPSAPVPVNRPAMTPHQAPPHGSGGRAHFGGRHR